jgi:selenophosphate synthetase-related protein
MDNKRLDLSKTIYELCSEFPELPEQLSQLGFKDITKPGMISTVGRFMTLPKGAAAKKLDLDMIKKALQDKGYDVI